ncbi:hypothetical protein TB15x_20715 [Xanthomonas perforans]|nr:hypothetical protein TB15x_20715 [Xanthomonas perforans]
MLVYTSDLSDDEFDQHGLSIRTDDTVLLVVEHSDPRNYQTDAIVAVVGDETERNEWGRRIPASITKLMRDAEDRCGPLAIMCEDVFVLVEHQGAERRS